MPAWRFDAIGTRWEIETDAALPGELRIEVARRIEAFDLAWSRFRADSLVSRLADGGRAPAPPDAPAMLDVYRQLSDATDGAVNPLVGESLVSLGYDAEVSLRSGPARPAPRWQDVLHWGDELVLEQAAIIDVGAVGKGRLVDLVGAALAGIPGTVVVDAGGDILVKDGGAHRIALEHPYDPRRAIGVVEIDSGAICGSAVNRRAWGDGLHHVLDARTGAPVRTWAATWAFAETAMIADAVTTALFFEPGPQLADRLGAAWVRMSTAGLVERSPDCPAELFTV